LPSEAAFSSTSVHRIVRRPFCGGDTVTTLVDAVLNCIPIYATRSSNEAVCVKRSTNIMGSPPSITDSGDASILHAVVTIHLDGVLPTRFGLNEHGAALTAVSAQCSDFEHANRSRASRIASAAACVRDIWRTRFGLLRLTVNTGGSAMSGSVPSGDERLKSRGDGQKT